MSREPELTNPNIVCVILKDGAFVVGDTLTGVTSYSYPHSPNATQARSKRKDLPGLVAFATKALADAHAGDEGPRSLVAYPEYHARNWRLLNEDPRKWGLLSAA